MVRESWKKYFDLYNIDKNRVNGHCKLCNQNYKDKNGVSSNFLKHIKRKHFFEYQQLFSNQDESLSEDLTIESDGHITTDISTLKSKQNRINIAIVKYLIIKCNLPLNLVENLAFRNFMKECNFKWDPISAKRVKHDAIPTFTEKVNKIIKETLDTVDHVTLTVDGWSDRRCRSFLGVTCHFINSKMEPQSFLIDFVRLKSPHTSEHIQQMTECILDRFNIKEKVYRIVTDNASSMIKAYKFGLSVDDDDEAVDIYNDEIKIMENTNIMLHDYDQDVEISNFQIINIQHDDHFNDCENSSVLRLSCFAHTLQLCVRDGLKKTSHIPKLLDKCATLAKFSHKSSKIADLLDQLNKHITKMNLTRWNSEYMLIKSILSINKHDLEAITSLMNTPVKFSNNDIIILEELVSILDPFYDISIKCQAETVVTVSLVVPSIVHLVTHLRDINEDISFCGKLVQQLQASIETRFSGIINRLNQVDVINNDHYGDPLYFIAAFLDPSFKFYWIRDLQLGVQMENRLKQNIIQLIINEISKDSKPCTTESHKANVYLTTSSSSSSTSRKKRRKLFNYEDSGMNDASESTTLDPAVELDAYLNDPVRSKFSDYWFHSQLNILKKLVARIFSVQASSAPIERVFSYAGLILSSRRTNMNEHLFRDLVFLRVNENLL
ncbi:unnamed protein product [Rotaria sp. Silwood2]|nr:unnamed protein product [Rotaria sp. Silwood2]CAF3145569.1 unnamed protein product [Rotaria sp. Silwood2]CAF3462524.1 unnamed protein product [Rotaria sp. Silwood2]CAF4214246.1 unnamed protein product [Rotaria sp. Silwood2]CAF4250281.1 unnamed protein product [Rotaria sp. Silwood2]